MRQRFYCQFCKQELDYEQTVQNSINEDKRNCKKCGHKKHEGTECGVKFTYDDGDREFEDICECEGDSDD